MKNWHKIIRNGEELVLLFQQLRDYSNTREMFVAYTVFAFATLEDTWCNDGRQVVQVHLAPSFLVDVGERCHPLEEDQNDFHCVSVCPRKEQAHEMHKPMPFAPIGYS